ncbi:Hypothetical predicted protein [Mytilus galloprovincialis]|uniref:Ig-like domain-containing protein n=1 Tax=Mytilus galloprovincialis TaxID=29158 RepID=A0A8B6CY89_MYTGA|nr:Hypothetical predicted protein [Mytilus galloprovincialis]VDI10946.1 Hypothetical predicted protein [Mytilus galloprovincialis]
MRLFAFFCSGFLATVNIQITNIILVVQNQATLAAAVQWKRETNPVLFGQNVTLTCMVDRKEGCDITATRRWDAGPDRNTLLLNGHSTNSSKYNEISTEPCENFSMVIMKFDPHDVNWEYWCSFGFETSRQMLMLDDRNFIGKPAMPDIYSSLGNDKQREIHLKIRFYKVYPNPKCKMKIGDTSWEPVTLTSHPTGVLYNSSVHYKTTFPKIQCHNNVTVVCSLLSYTILQLNKRLNCTAEDVSRETNYTMQMVIIPVSISVAFIIIMIIGCVCFILILKNSKDSPYHKSNIEEMCSLNG